MHILRDVLALEFGSFGFLRAFRVLRVVRAMKGFSGIRQILASLGESVRLLRNVVTLSFFSFYLFAVFALNMFMGLLHKEVGSTTQSWVADGSGSVSSLSDFGGKTETEAQSDQFKYANFDDIFSAVLTIFRAVTMEGWSSLCYALMDAVAPGWEFAIVLYHFQKEH
jgi:hypothetical protein